MADWIVARACGGHKDYLLRWDAEWGTACSWSVVGALGFPSRAAARAAARKARRCCMGWNRSKARPARAGGFFRAEPRG